jgi:hypothetical protein
MKNDFEQYEDQDNGEFDTVSTVEDVSGPITVYISDFGIYTEAKIVAMGFALPHGLHGINEDIETRLKAFLAEQWVLNDPSPLVISF